MIIFNGGYKANFVSGCEIRPVSHVQGWKVVWEAAALTMTGAMARLGESVGRLPGRMDGRQALSQRPSSRQYPLEHKTLSAFTIKLPQPAAFRLTLAALTGLPLDYSLPAPLSFPIYLPPLKDPCAAVGEMEAIHSSKL